MNTAPHEVADLGTVLGIWAHPDDEAYLSGGLMALARDAGNRVVCVTATRGERGTPDPKAWPPYRLAARRTRELAHCLSILGVTEHHWLGYADGGCPDVDAREAVDQLSCLIDEVRPDTVVTFGPDGITGHADHQVVSSWTGAAFVTAARPGMRLLHAVVPDPWDRQWRTLNQSLGVHQPGYPMVTPVAGLAVDLHLDPGTLERKVRALAAQETQTAALIAGMGIEQYTAWVAEEAFVEAAVGIRPGSRQSRRVPTVR